MTNLRDSVISQLNLKMDLSNFLDDMGWEKNLDKEGVNITQDCPFGCGAPEGSFVINVKTRIARCYNTSCEASKNLTLIELYSKLKTLPIDDSAIRIFENIGIENPEENQTLIRSLYLNIAEKYELEGMNEAAKVILLKAYQSFPKNLIILNRLANINIKDNCNEKAAKYLLNAIDIMVQMRNYSSAHSTVKRVLSLDPVNAKVREIQKEIFLNEWRDYLEEKFTKEEKENFENRISFKDIPLPVLPRITILIAQKNRTEFIKNIDDELVQNMEDNEVLQFIESLEKEIESEKNIDYLYPFLGKKFAELNKIDKAINHLNHAKESILAKKIETPLVDIETTLQKLEDDFYKEDFEEATNLIDGGNFDEASAILRKIINSGIKKHDIYDKYIICEYKNGNELAAADTCIELSDYFYRKDNHIGALVSLYRGLNFMPDYQPCVDKLISLYDFLDHKELAEELITEIEKRKKSGIKATSRESIKKVTDSESVEYSSPMTSSGRNVSDDKKEKSLIKNEISNVRPGFALGDIEDEIDLPASVTGTARAGKPAIQSSSKTALSSSELPFSAEDEIPIEMTVGFRLSGTDLTTDLTHLLEVTTISLGVNTCKINFGSKSIYGLPPASINYTLTNAQAIMTINIPDIIEPRRLFGQITKVQTIKTSGGSDRIVNFKLLTDDYPDRRDYIQFLENYRNGKIELKKESERNRITAPARVSSSSAVPSQKQPRPVSVTPADYGFARASSDSSVNQKPGHSKKIKTKNVAIRFVGYRDSNSKPLDPIPAKTISLNDNLLEVDYGALEIPGVRSASLNYFLKTNCDVMIEIEKPGTKQMTKVSAETVKTKSRREGKSLLISAELSIRHMDDPSAKMLLSYLE